MASSRTSRLLTLVPSNQNILLSHYARRNGLMLTPRFTNLNQKAYNSYGSSPSNDDFSLFSSPAPEFRGRTKLPRNTIINFVPQQEAWIIERFGKFDRLLQPGLAIVIPVLEQIKYVKGLKEICLNIPAQSAITQDNVTLVLDGVLYIKVIDPYKASYGVEDAEYAVAQLAQTTMRAEIGQMTLDRTLAERAHLNSNIVDAINSAADAWGIRCLRYEIRDIHPPERVVESMHQQVSAERSKRASILESEGQRQAAINVAEGNKQSVILASEAEKAERINKASGEAEGILLRAKATAEGIRNIAIAIKNPRGSDAVALTIAEKYVEAFGRLAKENNAIIVPASTNDAGSMIAQALSIFQTVTKQQHQQQQQQQQQQSSLNESSSYIKEQD